MAIQVRKKKPVLVAAGALIVVAALASGYCSWNTNLLGADSFRDGRLGSGDAQAALGSTGRLSQVHAQVDTQRAEFGCTIERTSHFIGGDDQRVTVRTPVVKGRSPSRPASGKTPPPGPTSKTG
ncbi:hypothetical protein [Streptomyces sp. NPDC056975]|uniref:hypothetical protein n=1 Tax=unclassified Streptomyces TaxID=2593676 RepID=UPI003629BA3E